MALEDIESSQKADEVDKTSLEAAAAWFAYAAPTLWALSEQGKEFQGKIVAAIAALGTEIAAADLFDMSLLSEIYAADPSLIVKG